MEFHPDLDYNADIETYKRTRKRLAETDTAGWSESKLAQLTAMIRDCDYIIQWLKTGHKPGPQRGVERLAGYQREKLVDPLIMQSYVQRGAIGSPTSITDGERQLIEDALSQLSPRERECYEMAHGYCISHSQIAEMLGIDRRNVGTLIQRAQLKLSKQYYQIGLHLVV